MKMKPLWIVVFSLIFVIVTTACVFIFTRLTQNPPLSWWYVGGWSIFEAVLGLAIGAIVLISRLQSKPEIKQKLDHKAAKARAINELKHDEDNPDNFMIEKQVHARVGEPGSPRTPILWLSGKGSETDQKIDCIIDLADPDAPITWLRNATEEQVEDAMRRKAENPENIVKEERVMGVDDYGRPKTVVTTRKVTQSEKQNIEEEKEANQNNIV